MGQSPWPATGLGRAPPQRFAFPEITEGHYRMYDLENRMNFVGYSILSNQWMLDWGWPRTSTSAGG